MIFALKNINQLIFLLKQYVLCVRYELDCHIYDLDKQFAIPEFWTEKLRSLWTFFGTLIEWFWLYKVYYQVSLKIKAL